MLISGGTKVYDGSTAVYNLGFSISGIILQDQISISSYISFFNYYALSATVFLTVNVKVIPPPVSLPNIVTVAILSSM